MGQEVALAADGSCSARRRRRCPAPQAAEHGDHAPHSPSVHESVAHDGPRHTADSAVSALHTAGSPPRMARCRACVPSPHAAEHADHAPHAAMTHAGHALPAVSTTGAHR